MHTRITGHTRHTMRAGIAALLGAALGGLVLSGCGDDSEPRPAVTVTETVTADGAAPAGSGTESGSDPAEPAADEPSDDTHRLTDTVVYENKSTITLSSFARGVSTDTASPENTPYVKFTLKVTNGTSEKMDMAMLTIGCQYGDEGKDSEQVFDSAAGLDGPSSTHVRPGRSSTATIACEFPKAEKYLQIEIAPDTDSQTAIFAGDVK
ncbi:hypothetical protein ACWF94_18500 [Streptomyces sp. NPDC055078]